jgi:hypothetical protein
MPWFDATKWTPWVFKGPEQNYATPDAVAAVFRPDGPVPAANPLPGASLKRPDPPKLGHAVIFPSAVPATPVERPQWIDEDGSPLDLPPPKPPIKIPGLVGELVDFCWHGSPYQIAEVAIASALSSMSLLCSRTYRHGTLGLSLYILLLAKTSVGKSFCFKANDAWANELAKQFLDVKPPHSEEAKKRLAYARNMIIGEIGSAQGLAQHMPQSPSTLFHGDEYVHQIKEMSRPNPPSHVAQMQAELLRLMEMSGPGRVYRGRKYSKRGKTEEEVDVIMASLSILATGTPEKFYDEMQPSLLENGFLPRFTLLEYSGNLTRKNPEVIDKPSEQLMKKITMLFNMGFERGRHLTGDLSEVIDVQPIDKKASDRLDWFENVCQRNVVKANRDDLQTAGLWSRAKEQVKKISCLIAIGVNPYQPQITEEYVNSAIAIIMPNLEKLVSRIVKDEVGTGDPRRRNDVMKYMAKLYVGGYAKYGKGKSPIRQELIDVGIIQVAIVKNYCSHLASFRNCPQGFERAFKDIFDSLVRYGDVKLVDAGGPLCVTLDLNAFAQIFHDIAGSADETK